MNSKPVNLDELNNGKEIVTPTFLDNVTENVKEHFNVDSSTIAQEVNRQQLNTLKKKNKDKNFSLYSLFQSVQGLLDQCKPTTDEMFTRHADGSYVLSEAGNIVASTSIENKTLMLDFMELFNEVVDEPEILRKGFIKEKVMQNRYSRRGAEYATLFNNIGDKIFALTTQCLNVQVIINDLLQNQPETEEEQNA